jgi:hypothetical protein
MKKSLVRSSPEGVPNAAGKNHVLKMPQAVSAK